ncbi:hypothetical protein Cadr_000030990 [Camelus dromedarius]|uniref:Uncharacterized protein n=1 Tax=Camelus dromedarius TaxID=9838 RepID=A0A5N4C0I5_CAMDR|nr:hypothetical protein Cadr_000030990 [Camelus dromedarius]
MHAQSVPAGTSFGSSSSEPGIGSKAAQFFRPLSGVCAAPWLRASSCKAQLLLVESGKGSVSAERASFSSLSVSAPGKYLEHFHVL